MQVKVLETNSNIENKPSYFNINVEPPLWRSSKAFLLYVFILIVMIILIIIIVKRYHKKNLEKQKLEMEFNREREMNESKMKFFTNVSHDLKTPLSLIISPVERLISEKSHSKKDDLKLIHRNAIILMDEINQLLDFRKMNQNKISFNLSFTNFAVFLRALCPSYTDMSSISNGLTLETCI